MKRTFHLKGWMLILSFFILFTAGYAQNVGIGTTTPGQKLEVMGNIKLGDNLMVEGYDDYKVYRNLATYSYPANLTGAYVIQTSQNYDCLWSITVEGQEYPGLAFEYTIWGNNLTAFYTFTGSLELPVTVGRYSTSLVIIIGTAANTRYQPKITVTEFRQGRAHIQEGGAEGWTAAVYSDLSWIVSQAAATRILNGVWSQNGLDAYYNLGEVGIGTISPAYPLHVLTTATTTGTRAVYGLHNSTGTGAQLYGLVGEVKSTNTADPGAGVYGFHNNTTGSSAGVKGVSASGTGKGVFGYATDNFGLNFGVYGKTNSPSGYAGYFEGGVNYFQGDVGIGTYPSHRLHITNGNVKVENATCFTYLNATNATTGQAGIQLQKNGTPRKSIYISNSNDHFVIYDNPTTHFDLSITPTGNVGIGTNAPTSRLHIYGGDAMLEHSEVYLKFKATNGLNFSGLTFYNHEGTYKRAFVYSNLYNKLFFYNAVHARYDIAIDDDGQVGIGTTDPATHLEVRGNGFQTLRIKSSTPNDVALELMRYNAGGTNFIDWRMVNDNAILRLLFSADDFATDPTDGFTFTYVNPNGTNSWFGPMDDGNKYLGYPSNRWAVVYAVNGTIQTSDIREKENISELTYGIEEVMKLHPVSYTWKKWPEQGVRLGLIAQEVEPVLQEVVKLERPVETDEHGHLIRQGEEVYGMSYDQLIPVLIKAIQEQQGQIDAMQDRIRELEMKVPSATR